MPIARRYPLADLMSFLREFPLERGRRITFEYVLIHQFNDTINDARATARLIRGIRAKVNVIPLNEDGEHFPDLRRPLEEYGLILKHGQRVERLSTGEDDRFNELLASGEEALREGKYFWAERRFDRALRFVPGHPMATAGLANTQIAAGLYLSAAITLRSLFTYQPEMMDVRYEPGLLPNRPYSKSAGVVGEVLKHYHPH